MKYLVMEDKKGKILKLVRITYEEFTNKYGRWSCSYYEDDKIAEDLKITDYYYTFREIKPEDVRAVEMEIESNAYDDYHEFVSDCSRPAKDRKGKEHKEYIYQDYRTLDGYLADSQFNYNEILYRDDFDYYIDKENDVLIKKNKEDNKCYVFGVQIDKNILMKKWFKPEEYDPKVSGIIQKYNYDKMKKTKSIEDVIKYIDKYYYNAYNGLKEDITKIEKARKLAIEKWGEEKYLETKHYFDNAEKDADYMDAVNAFLLQPDIPYTVFIDLATID